ncbi:chromatin remodeling complex subunit [Flagelloscypha sp. PMI_526]|nr:chromatin remodeling complex subunit [Flagelloscypha sp. PMI_526]
MDVDVDPSRITHVFRPSLPSIPPPGPSYAAHRNSSIPIVIDNGSTHLRWGFADWTTPGYGPNVIAKFKERRTNRPVLLFGDGVDVDSGARAQAKYAWEADILLNFDALENALDYAFVNMNIDTPTIEHPVIMSERLATPLHSRGLTSELMFELYNVPTLTFCNDGLMSFYKNKHPSNGGLFTSDGLVVSFNTASTSVVPIVAGKGIMSQAKRIQYGGSQAAEYLLKLVQLKYPTFPTRMSSTQATWMLQSFCEFSPDYKGLMKKLADPLEMRKHETVVQFPFSMPSSGEEKGEDELREREEKRKEQGKRLQEMAAEKRAEMLVQKANDLEELVTFRDTRDEEDEGDWFEKLDEYGFEDENQLHDTIKKLDADLKKAAKKDSSAVDNEEMEEPSYPLLDVPDEELDDMQLKEKRKQKLMKAGWEARVKARKEKEREREEQMAKDKEEEDERLHDLSGWSNRLRGEQEALMFKIKERARRKAALNDRKSAASQARMKNIANLASDDARVPKKKRKLNGEDDFGADDADWAIYRKIQTGEASDDEDADLQKLQQIESKLLTHDPNFTFQETHHFLTSQRSLLISAFKPQYPDGDIAGAMRIHLNVERWRVPEVWFQPYMAGIDSAGLGEVCANVLNSFNEDQYPGVKQKLLKNVFLTGTPSTIPNLSERLYESLRPLMPPEMDIQIDRAEDASLDAWKGMARFALEDGTEFSLGQTGVSRAEYEEFGGERIRRWWGGNWNGGFVPERSE